MKERVVEASWAVQLLSDLGQNNLLLGKSHVWEKMERERERHVGIAAGKLGVLWSDSRDSERRRGIEA